MLMAMGITAFLCIFLGVFPDFLYQLLPYEVVYIPYTTSHVLSQLQLLCFALLAFTVLMRVGLHPPEITAINLDTDWVYRIFLAKKLSLIGANINLIVSSFNGFIFHKAAVAEKILFRFFGPLGGLAKAGPDGLMIMWIALIFSGALILVLF